jgi:hypothetical protein
MLAMLAREEVGRSRILMSVATDARNGKAIAPADVNEQSKAHHSKHKAGVTNCPGTLARQPLSLALR